MWLKCLKEQYLASIIHDGQEIMQSIGDEYGKVSQNITFDYSKLEKDKFP